MAPATKKASSRGVKKEDQKAAASGGFAKLFAVKPAEKETPAAGAEQPEKAKAANPLQKLFGAQAKTPATEAKPNQVQPKPNQVQQTVSQAPSPARSTAPSPVADTASEPAAGKPALTQEQLARIEENKRKAREKQQAKRAREEPTSPKVEETPSPQRTVSRPAAVNSPGQNVVTPEKVSQERRAAATPQPAATTEVIPASAGRFAAAALECKNWMQYHDLYALRVKQLKRRAQEEAQNLWGGILSPASFLTEITGYKRKGECAEVVLVGILFKELKGRANVIEQYKDIKVGSFGQGAEAEAAQRLNTETDTLWLEDGSMRLQLQMQPEQVANLPTGVVVGVRGTAMADGKFSVKAHCFPRMASPPPLPTAPVQGRFLALVSGLAFGREEGAEGLASARSRAMDFLLKGGERGEVVERLLVCGGTFSHGSDLETGSISKAALQDADDFFAGLAASVPINLMPGRGDPANLCLPQLPPVETVAAMWCKGLLRRSVPWRAVLPALPGRVFQDARQSHLGLALASAAGLVTGGVVVDRSLGSAHCDAAAAKDRSVDEPFPWAWASDTCALWQRDWDKDWDGRAPPADHPMKAEGRMRHIIFIRHGQYDLDSESNALTELGRQQSHKVGERLAAMLGKTFHDLNNEYNIHFAGIWSSDVLRARQTAEIIAEHLPEVPLHPPDMLLAEGKPAVPYPQTRKGVAKTAALWEDSTRIELAFRRYVHRDVDHKVLAERRAREEKAAKKAAKDGSGDAPASETTQDKIAPQATPAQPERVFAIVVCHCNVIRYFTMRSLQLPPEAWLRLGGYNTGLTEVTIRPNGSVTLVRFGDTGHLPVEMTTFH